MLLSVIPSLIEDTEDTITYSYEITFLTYLKRKIKKLLSVLPSPIEDTVNKGLKKINEFFDFINYLHFLLNNFDLHKMNCSLYIKNSIFFLSTKQFISTQMKLQLYLDKKNNVT